MDFFPFELQGLFSTELILWTPSEKVKDVASVVSDIVRHQKIVDIDDDHAAEGWIAVTGKFLPKVVELMV